MPTLRTRKRGSHPTELGREPAPISPADEKPASRFAAAFAANQAAPAEPKPDPFEGKSAHDVCAASLATMPAEVLEAADRRPPATTRTLPPELACALPYNRTTGVQYQGANIMRLASAEAAGAYETAGGWAGFRQWLEHGRVVRKGEHGTPILRVFTTDDGKRVTGGRVFHYDQTVELEAPEVTS